MTVSAAPGSNERTRRSAPIATARTLKGTHLGRLVQLIDTGDAGGIGLLLVVGLLLGLIVISAGCGPPS
jgi:hypothetical protein